MLGQAQEDVGQAVVGVQLLVVHLAGEDDLVDPQLAHHLLQAVEVALEAAVVAHQRSLLHLLRPWPNALVPEHSVTSVTYASHKTCYK